MTALQCKVKTYDKLAWSHTIPRRSGHFLRHDNFASIHLTEKPVALEFPIELQVKI